MSLVARHLEANGLPTVIIGSALDVVEHCGVPRFVFTDFPLGNPCGPPYRRDIQRTVVAMALDLLSSATEPPHTNRSRTSRGTDTNFDGITVSINSRIF